MSSGVVSFGVRDGYETAAMLEALADAHAKVAESMRQRDALIRHAYEQGVTMYRIAQVTGLTSQAVRLCVERAGGKSLGRRRRSSGA